MGWVCDSLCRIQPCSYSAAIRCADKAIMQKCLLDNLQYLWLHLTGSRTTKRVLLMTLPEQSWLGRFPFNSDVA